MAKYYEEVCLYEQPFIKENTTTIDDLIKTKIAKLGENISVSRFARFKVGDHGSRRAGSGRNTDDIVPQYERILLKLSGEVMAGRRLRLASMPERVAALASEDGGGGAHRACRSVWWWAAGTFFRGVAAAARNMDRVTADHMGMLATVINALALAGRA